MKPQEFHEHKGIHLISVYPPPWGGGGVGQNLELKGILSKNLELKQIFVDLMLNLRYVVYKDARDVPHKAQE